MPIITAIKPQIKNADRISLFVDGDFFCGLCVRTVGECNISVGQEMTISQLNDIIFLSQVDLAYLYGTRLLCRRYYSVYEIEQKLIRKEYPSGVRLEVIDQLTKTDLLDDLRFARAWVRDRLRFNPKGRYGLKAELQKKGVDNETIEQVIEQEYTDEEIDIARELIYKKRRSYEGLDRDKTFRRVVGFLLRRGFSYDTAKTCAVETVDNNQEA